MRPSRRAFLKTVVGGSALVSLPSFVPGFLRQTARSAQAAPPRDDTVLVVVQLTGGNDGLNTVVPYSDDAYGRARRSLRLSPDKLHRIDGQLGFHEQMPGFWQLLQEGQLSVVQGVGYPSASRSHDEALRDWHTAQPGDASCQTGWIGRFADAGATTAVGSVLVAPIAPPFALNAERSVVPAVRSLDEWLLREASPPVGQQVAPLEVDAVGTADQDSLLEMLRCGTREAYLSSEKVRQVLATADDDDRYPSMSLARQLRVVAQLMRADLGIRIFFTELGGGGLGGFDNHANQRDNHAALLRELSASVTAFVQDLQRSELLSRALLMTFSEFGRTLTENGRRGTDHGLAAPVFLAGGRLRGGLVGDHPSLTDLEGDAPRFHTDFRRLYATVLDRWLKFDSRLVLAQAYEPIDLFG